eukprot:5457505-Karenia_brevis.AAC.1
MNKYHFNVSLNFIGTMWEGSQALASHGGDRDYRGLRGCHIGLSYCKYNNGDYWTRQRWESNWWRCSAEADGKLKEFCALAEEYTRMMPYTQYLELPTDNWH